MHAFVRKPQGAAPVQSRPSRSSASATTDPLSFLRSSSSPHAAPETSADAAPPVRSGEMAQADAGETAAAGTRGAGGTLPHLELIQRSFGKHDVSTIEAHTGEAAADASLRLGAKAFTVGERVAFGGAPSLFTAAHEAAHAVQHRAGAQAAGSIGKAGDVHEQHADAVAERVVRGESSESLLDSIPGAPGGVQLQTGNLARAPATHAVHLDEAEREKRYNDALKAKKWDVLAGVLAEYDSGGLDEKLGSLSLEEKASVHKGALKNPKLGAKSEVAKRTRASYLDWSYQTAAKAAKWDDAAKFLNELDYADVVVRVEKLSAADQASLRAEAVKGSFQRVVGAVDALPQIKSLRSEKATLEAATAPGSGKSFGEVGSAYAKLKDVSHDLKVLETGTGLYEGNQSGTKTPGAKQTDCTMIVLEVLENTFTQQGKAADWAKVKKKYQANTKARGDTNLSGLDVQAALQSEAGWKGIFWAPDPSYQVPEAELSGAKSSEANYAYTLAKKGTYYKDFGKKGYPGVAIDKTVVNYAPEAPNQGYGAASPTKKDTTGLAKLQKLPFGILAAHGGHHMTIITYGKVIEVHWDQPASSVAVIEQQDLATWAVGENSGYHYFASGAIVAPAADVKAAFP